MRTWMSGDRGASTSLGLAMRSRTCSQCHRAGAISSTSACRSTLAPDRPVAPVSPLPATRQRRRPTDRRDSMKKRPAGHRSGSCRTRWSRRMTGSRRTAKSPASEGRASNEAGSPAAFRCRATRGASDQGKGPRRRGRRGTPRATSRAGSETPSVIELLRPTAATRRHPGRRSNTLDPREALPSPAGGSARSRGSVPA